MIDELVKKPFYIQRMRAGLAGPHIDDFAVWLRKQGFAPRTICKAVRNVRALSVWAGRRGLSLKQFDDEILLRFDSHRKLGRHSTRSFLRFLRERGLAPRPVIAPPSESPLVASFHDWMHAHRGVQFATLANYTPVVSELLKAAGGKPSGLGAPRVRAFVLDHASRHGRCHAKTVVTATRMFLRYLVTQGHCPATLVGAVPVVADWKHGRLPRHLPPADVERVLASCDLGTVVGRRDHAILLLLARLGLRAGDVAGLTFDAIDWLGGRLRVCGKNRRETWLPLPQDVGDAILTYLKHGRPKLAAPQVFFKVIAPLGAITRWNVSRLVGTAIRRAGVRAPSHGAHVLRHSAASSMLREGASLEEIGSVLRHASIETTLIYAKVDCELLRMVVAPWPAAPAMGAVDHRITSLDLYGIAQRWPEVA
jgi:site-specific recombinase XerD